jgi:asparagine synthetase B (glutamine-hydrolysing)
LAYLQGFPAKDTTRFSLWLAALSAEELRCLMPEFPNRFFDRCGSRGSFFDYVETMMAPAADATRQQMLHYFYQKSFLPEFVCMHTDRAAMQVGLEVRSPFLSIPLIKFANRLPDSLKLRNGDTKWLLRAAAARAGVPATVVFARKRGFTFPIARWLKTTLKSPMEKILDNPVFADAPLDMVEVCRLMDEHLAGRRNHYRILYNLMVFARWREKYPTLPWAEAL